MEEPKALPITTVDTDTVGNGKPYSVDVLEDGLEVWASDQAVSPENGDGKSASASVASEAAAVGNYSHKRPRSSSPPLRATNTMGGAAAGRSAHVLPPSKQQRNTSGRKWFVRRLFYACSIHHARDAPVCSTEDECAAVWLGGAERILFPAC